MESDTEEEDGEEEEGEEDEEGGDGASDVSSDTDDEAEKQDTLQMQV